MAAPDPYRFSRRGRSLRVIGILALVYAGVAVLLIRFQTVYWIAAGLVVPTLPALWELWSNPASGLTLDDRELRWFSGRRSATIYLGEIDHMRFDTRWDFSVRVSAVLRDGKKIRLPHESTPPHLAFETALTARGVKVERHHFTIF